MTHLQHHAGGAVCGKRFVETTNDPAAVTCRDCKP